MVHVFIFIASTLVALYMKLTRRFTVDKEGMLWTILEL